MEKRAIDSSLNKGGKCILVLKEKLQQTLRRSNFMKNISLGRLTIISAFPPQAKATPDPCYDLASCLSSVVMVLRSGKKDVVARCLNRSVQNQWTPIFRRTQTSNPPPIFCKSRFENGLKGENAKDDLDTILSIRES